MLQYNGHFMSSTVFQKRTILKLKPGTEPLTVGCQRPCTHGDGVGVDAGHTQLTARIEHGSC